MRAKAARKMLVQFADDYDVSPSKDGRAFDWRVSYGKRTTTGTTREFNAACRHAAEALIALQERANGDAFS